MKLPFRLVWRNLAKHKLRSLLTMGSLFVALFLLCVLRSLVVTLDRGVKNARTDRVIVQSAVSLFVELPNAYVDKIKAVDGVQDVCGWNWFSGTYQDEKQPKPQFGCDIETLLRMYPEIVIDEGDVEKLKSDRKACVIGRKLANDYNLTIGSNLPLMSTIYPRADGGPWNFEVAAIYHSTSGLVDNATMYFHYDYLHEAQEQGAALGPRGVGLYVAKIAPGKNPVTVMHEIDQLFTNGPQRVTSTSEAEFNAQFVSMMGNIPFFVSAIGTGVIFAILLAVVNTMLMAAREQTRDTGILKALGFTNSTVFVAFLMQSLAIALIGGGAGVMLAKATSAGFADLLGTTFPNYQVTRDTILLALGATLAIGLIAGMTPASRLARAACVRLLRTEA